MRDSLNESVNIIPGGYADFLNYLDTVKTEEQLFSRLTYWFAFRTSPEDAQSRPALVEARANELGFWKGLNLKIARWQKSTDEELARVGKDEFESLIGSDYAAYRDGKSSTSAESQPIKAYSAQQLAKMTLPPMRYIVDEVIPMGLGVLVAKPKIGKSWMILDLCLSVADGASFLGFQTHKHGTLYLALEDGPTRMQTRIKKVLEDKPAPSHMHIMFEAPRLDGGLLDQLESYLDEHPDIHLVCIDTLSKIKPKAKPFENAYDSDYDYLGILKKFADSRGICLLIVHHTRKGKNIDDAFDNINGSTGIMGAADFTIVLDKQNRMDDEASFILTGRDIEQQERIISFDKDRCKWTMQGTATEIAAQRRIQAYEDNPIVQTLRILLQQGDGTWTGNAQNLIEMGQHYTHEELAPSSQALAKSITELEPLLWERDAIKHWIKSNPGGGKRHQFKMSRTDNTIEQAQNEQLALKT